MFVRGPVQHNIRFLFRITSEIKEKGGILLVGGTFLTACLENVTSDSQLICRVSTSPSSEEAEQSDCSFVLSCSGSGTLPAEHNVGPGGGWTVIHQA